MKRPDRDPAVVVRALRAPDAAACDAIVATLPEYFGIDEGLRQCARDVRSAPGFVAVIEDRVVGFLTTRQHFPAAVEITWMAVHAVYRRRGIGQQLISHLCGQLRRDGVRLLLLLTVSASDLGDAAGVYEGTRRFYQRVGFIPAYELPDL